MMRPEAFLVFGGRKSHNRRMWDFKHRTFLGDIEEKNRVPAIRRNCNVPGCEGLGEHRAPKSRYDLRDYYWFCLDHVREYNASWDYFKGMNRAEIEHHMTKTAVWDRPSWRMTQAGLNEERARQKIYEAFTNGESVFGDFGGPGDENEKAHIDVAAIPHPTLEALAVMGLAPPIGWEEVKTRYKTLAKKYHPDTNKDDKAEEQLKKINLAYSILKISYQSYVELDD